MSATKTPYAPFQVGFNNDTNIDWEYITDEDRREADKELAEMVEQTRQQLKMNKESL